MPRSTVVIADDDPVTRMDLRAMLESMDLEVVAEAGNGQDACRQVRRHKPSLIIMDVAMPSMTGLEAAASLSPDRIAPIILLTAFSEDRMIQEATQAGVLAYLVKPFRSQDLKPAIEIAMARFRELLALESERDELHEQIETRRAVGHAKAILVARHDITEREALRRIQAQGLAMSKTLRQIAEAIILTEDLDRNVKGSV